MTSVDKKVLKEKYAKKEDPGEAVVRLCLRILGTMSVFIFVALGVDIYNLFH